MKDLVIKTGKIMVGTGLTKLGWNLLFRGDDVKEEMVAGAIIAGMGAGIVGIGNVIKDKDIEVEELEDVVEIGV